MSEHALEANITASTPGNVAALHLGDWGKGGEGVAIHSFPDATRDVISEYPADTVEQRSRHAHVTLLIIKSHLGSTAELAQSMQMSPSCSSCLGVAEA